MICTHLSTRPLSGDAGEVTTLLTPACSHNLHRSEHQTSTDDISCVCCDLSFPVPQLDRTRAGARAYLSSIAWSQLRPRACDRRRRPACSTGGPSRSNIAKSQHNFVGCCTSHRSVLVLPIGNKIRVAAAHTLHGSRISGEQT